MPVTKKHLKLLSWNAQSISNNIKRFELGLLLSKKEVDIVCIQETFLNEKTKLFLHGYKTFRCDRSSHGGGVAIAVKNNIICKQIKSFTTDGIENIAILIYFDSKQILIVSAYSPSYNDIFRKTLIHSSLQTWIQLF